MIWLELVLSLFALLFGCVVVIYCLISRRW
jgi:hypothetical protein